MPWILSQSVRSFRDHNPDWEVEIINIDGGNKLDIIKHSDQTRYSLLSNGGGAYFDTDIFFLKPLDKLMQLIGDCDTVVCFETSKPMTLVRNNGSIETNAVKSMFYSVASLMSGGKNDFWAEAAKYSRRPDIVEEPDPQACGIWTLTERFESLDKAIDEFPQHKFHNLHRRAFLPVAYDEVSYLYRMGSESLVDRWRVDPEVFGVHWYGGDHISRISEKWTPDDYWKDCAVGRLLGEA